MGNLTALTTAATKKVDGAYLYVTNRLRHLVSQKKEGNSELVVGLFLIVIAVGLSGFYKDEIQDLLTKIFTDAEKTITDTLIKNPTT